MTGLSHITITNRLVYGQQLDPIRDCFFIDLEPE